MSSMNATGLSQLLSKLSPSTSSSGSSGGGGGGFSAPSVGSVLAWGTATVAGYCLYEQLRFMWARRGKDGKSLPGEWLGGSAAQPIRTSTRSTVAHV